MGCLGLRRPTSAYPIGYDCARRWPLIEPPDLFQTLDHRAYLAEWFSWKKQVNPRFSHRVFARLAGVRSPSLLLLVMQGKRNLTSQTLEGVCRAMSLDHEEQEYLAALVDLDAAQTPEEKSRVFIRLSAMRRFQAARRIEGEGFRYLSVWYLPAIRELAACAQFRADPAWVAEQLRPRVTVAEAEEGLALLVRLGMLVADDEGRLRPADVSLVTPHEVAGLAVHNYHRGMLARASESITAFLPHERHLGAVTVAVPKKMLPALKRELAAFQERVLDLAESAQDGAELVIQVNLQLFPLSDPNAGSVE